MIIRTSNEIAVMKDYYKHNLWIDSNTLMNFLINEKEKTANMSDMKSMYLLIMKLKQEIHNKQVNK